MRIKRREVLRAIRTEILGAGDFAEFTKVYDLHGKFLDKIYKPNCKVCAVGAVLRQKGVETISIIDRAWELIGKHVTSAGDGGNEDRALEDKNYLLALSIKFEKLSTRYGANSPTTKRALANFVKENFPVQFNTVGK